MKKMVLCVLVCVLPSVMFADKLDAESAVAVTKKFVVAIEKDDVDTFKKCLSAEALQKIKQNGGVHSVALPPELKLSVDEKSVKIMEDKKRAKVKVVTHMVNLNTSASGTTILVAENGKWKIAQGLSY